MKREDFGFVMSRVMAVWLLASVIRDLAILPSTLQQVQMNSEFGGSSTRHLLFGAVAMEAVLIAGNFALDQVGVVLPSSA
jgi:hypothetical protein